MTDHIVTTHTLSFDQIIGSMDDLSDDEIINFILSLEAEHLELSSTKELIRKLQAVVDLYE